MQRARITWTPTNLGDVPDFAAYRVRRDGELIARVTSIAQAAFDDLEGRRSIMAAYDVSIERTDGTYAVPTAAGAAAPAAVEACTWALATNLRRDLAIDIECDAERQYTFRSDKVRRRLYGRDFEVGFSGTEQRGDEFVLHVIRFRDNDGGVVDRDLYDQLVAIADADVPYVAVLSPYGRRWFATLELTDAQQSLNDTAGVAPIIVSQAASQPYVVAS